MDAARLVRDAGETLIEIVISIMFVAIAVTAMVTAVGTGAVLTDGHRTLVATDVALKSGAEAVKGAPFQTADQQAQYQSAAAAAVPVGYTISVQSVKCIPSTTSTTYDTAAATTCTSAHTLQLVSLRVTSSGTDESTVVMKRKS